VTSQVIALDRHATAPGSGRGSLLERAEFHAAALAVFFAPINYLRLDVAYVTLGDVFAVLCVGLILLNGRLSLRPFGKATSLWFASLLLLTSGLMLSSILVGDPLVGAIVTGQYVFAYVLVPLVILRRPERELTILIMTFVASLIFVTLHGAYHINFAERPSPFISGNGRLLSLVERTNEVACLLAFAIIFSIWLYLARHVSAAITMLSVLVLGYGLLLTGSNSGLLLTGTGILGLTLLSGSARFSLALVGIGGAAVVAMLLWGESFLPQIFIDRVLVALQEGDPLQAGTFAGRLLLMQEAVAISNGTTFMGIGADQYRHVSIYSAPVHNVYLLVLAEGGLIALVGLTGLLLSLVYLGWSALNDARSRLGGAIALTIAAMFAVSMTGIPHCYARFWVVPIILAVAVSLSGRSDAATHQGTKA
jgi:O-antigen ligase